MSKNTENMKETTRHQVGMRWVCDGVIHLRVDYHPDILLLAQELDGEWDTKLKRWIFEWDQHEKIVDAVKSVFGHSVYLANAPKIVDVRVTLTKDISAPCSAIKLFKQTVATAVGRKTIDGAELGERIILEKGGFSSGGCESYPSNPAVWATKGSKGTTFIFKGVHDDYIESHYDSDFAIEVLSSWDPIIEKILKDKDQWKPRLV